MKVSLLQVTPNAVEFIGKCAAICYNSSTTTEACVKRASACTDKGHLATLRFAHATFHIQGISRVCSHQFVRSKHLDFLQRSQRYCKEGEATFVVPNHSMDTSALIHKHNAYCLSMYNQLLQEGMKKEDARFVLPEATQTELIVTGNFQAWLDFIKLRADTHAQWEIRTVAKEINNILADETHNKIFEWMP